MAIGDAGRASSDKLTQRLKPRGLSQARWTALLYLSRVPGGLTQSELARMLGIEAPTPTRLLKQLEENGWMTRTAPPEDGRIKMVQLTPKAKRVVVRINAAIAELRAKTAGKLSDEQAAERFAALRAVQKLVEQAEYRHVSVGTRHPSLVLPLVTVARPRLGIPGADSLPILHVEHC